MKTKKRLSGKEKFAYGIGAVGKDMVYMLSASYILYYYQDICGVKAWIMGIILLIARVFDAFNDPIMGVLVAKTKTRWGKFRPWLLIGTLTNAVVLYFMFAAPPSLNGSGLVAYAAIFYIVWGVTYTMMDIPYWSMVPAFTDGGKERENLSALARSCAGVGSAIITIITVMSVSALGTMISSNNANHKTVTFASPEISVTTYVLERDEEGLATGNVTEIEYGNVFIELVAPDSVLNDRIYCTGDNTNYQLRIGDKEWNKDNSAITFAVDNIKDKEAVLALYINENDYKEVAGISDEIKLMMQSTNEVERIGFKYFSLIIAVIFFVFILITCIFIKEKSTVDVESPSVGTMFKALLQNDQAMTMVITIVLINCSTYLTSNLLIYFFKYDLSGRNWQGNYTLFNTLAGAFQILAMMLLFPVLRKFMNTIKIFYVSVISAIVGYVILFFMALGGTNSVYPYFIPGFFIMSAVGVLNVLVTIFLANTVDYGEIKNGRRDESVIFSMQTFVVKLASGISVMVASLCLQIFHITSESNEIEGSVVEHVNSIIQNIKGNVIDTIANSSVLGLRLSMTLGPIIVLIIAIIYFRKKYTLSDEKLAEITLELEHTRKGE